MPEITGVRERRGRARISVDGEFWAEIDAGVAIECGLREGAVFSSEELERARVAGERPIAMGRALNLLGYRARSEAEIRERLRRYGYVDETIEVVIHRLEELGYLDDAEFARARAHEKARRYGPRRVSIELRKSGAWFAYGEERLGQGRENAKQFLKENYEVRERILEEIYEKLGLLGSVETVDEVAEGVAEEPAGQVL